jgi:hypothetical protein
VHSDATDGHPVVHEDGQSIVDEAPEAGPTIRDAQGTVLSVRRGGPPVTGVRLAVGTPGFPAPPPAVATPTA